MMSARPTKEPMTTPAIAPSDNLVALVVLVVFGGVGVGVGMVWF